MPACEKRPSYFGRPSKRKDWVSLITINLAFVFPLQHIWAKLAPSLGPPTRYYLMSRGLLDMGLNVGKNEGPIRDKGRFRNIRFSSVLWRDWHLQTRITYQITSRKTMRENTASRRKDLSYFSKAQLCVRGNLVLLIIEQISCNSCWHEGKKASLSTVNRVIFPRLGENLT